MLRKLTAKAAPHAAQSAAVKQAAAMLETKRAGLIPAPIEMYAVPIGEEDFMLMLHVAPNTLVREPKQDGQKDQIEQHRQRQ